MLGVAFAGCFGPAPPGGRDYGIPHYVLEPGTGHRIETLSAAGHSGSIRDVDRSADGTLLALAVGGGDLELWASNGTLLTRVVLAGEMDARCGGPSGMVRILDGGKLYTLFDSCARIYDRQGALESQWEYYGSVRYSEHGISRDGTHLVATDNYTALRVWNLTAGTSVRVDEEANALMDFGITPDGKWLVTVGQEPYGAGTKFYRIDDASGSATLVSTFARKGHLTFSDVSNIVIQDRWSFYGSHNETVMRFTANETSVEGHEWACYPPAGSFERPVCPSTQNSLGAVSPDGLHLAWKDTVTAQWLEEDFSGTQECAVVVRILDFQAPNATRGFQVGPSDSVTMGPGQGACFDVDAYLRSWVADDGTAVAVSHTAKEPDTVHITTAAANATAPFVSGTNV